MKKIKVPTPRQKPNGKWFLQVMVNGKRFPVTESTEEACIARAMALKQSLIEAEDRSRKPTLSVAIDRYIEDRQNLLSPATIRGYRTLQRNRFKTAMHKPVDAFGERGWQNLINAEAEIVSAKTVMNAWGLVHSVIKRYAKKEYDVSLPQVTSEPSTFLDWTEIPPFINAVLGTKYEIPALLALHSLRCSEITALTWENVDLKKGVIKVFGAIVPDENNKYVRKKENKNKTSQRIVPIMIPQLKEALEREKKPSGRVVTLHSSSILNGVKRTCERAGVTVVGTHGLRHSFASLAYHLQMPKKIAKRIGGWKNDATMEKIYTHIADLDVQHHQNEMTAFYNNPPSISTNFTTKDQQDE